MNILKIYLFTKYFNIPIPIKIIYIFVLMLKKKKKKKKKENTNCLLNILYNNNYYY